ncbi:MAG: fructose-bisphosphate aldolase [Gammaproteobacteria bacterium]|nr:fructose-bisphosphate aldolase [Gammaproteobacteria bacterium]
MALVDMHDMLGHAYRNGYAVGAFDVLGMEFLAGIIAAAESCDSPVVLSLNESRFEHSDFDSIMPAVEGAAQRAAVPVAILLDGCASYESAVRSTRAGCNGIAVDGRKASLDDHIEQMRHVVEVAHGCGMAAGGGAGNIAWTDDANVARKSGEGIPASVEEAAAYVQRTGVDFLALALPARRGGAFVDFERLKRVKHAVNVPLRLRNAIGLSHEHLQALTANGVAMIEAGAALSDVATERLRYDSAAYSERSYAALMKGVRDKVTEEVARLVRLWGGAGRGLQSLGECRPWKPVEHVIVFNSNTTEEAVHDMMGEGAAVLGAIPGVRHVFTGQALQPEAGYRYCWLVRFAHPAVVESYRVHPDHQSFADRRFRPSAPDRISIDFLEVEGHAAHPPRNPSAR